MQSVTNSHPPPPPPPPPGRPARERERDAQNVVWIAEHHNSSRVPHQKSEDKLLTHQLY